MPAGGDGNHAVVVADAHPRDDADWCATTTSWRLLSLWYMEPRRMRILRGHKSTQRMQEPCNRLKNLNDEAMTMTMITRDLIIGPFWL